MPKSSYPNINGLLEKVDSRFTLVILAAKRARQINDYLNSLRRAEFPGVRGPSIEKVHSKPLTVAFEEIVEGKIGFERTAEGIK